MTKQSPSWAVVATVDEPPALVLAFVAWHLALGASEVFIYCDNPDDPIRDALADHPQVHVCACDQPHWQRIGKSRPHRHQVRQVHNARDAYARTDADWLLHCDADEFLWVGPPVTKTLLDVSAAVDCLVLPVAERVHGPEEPSETIFEGAFRRPFRGTPKRGELLFGADYALTCRGLTGHAHGKAFVRTGRGLQMSVHRPRSPGRDQDVLMARAHPATFELLHFEGLTPRFWSYKLARMVYALAERDGMPPSTHRRRQADALIADPVSGAALYRRLKCPDADLRQRLEKLELWSAPIFDPAPAVAKHFSDQPYDPSPVAVEVWLADSKDWLLRYLNT